MTGGLAGALLALAVARCAAGEALPRPEELGVYAEPMRGAVERATVHQKVGPMETPMSLEIAVFLLDHPDMAAWLARRHKLAPYVIVMKGPGRSWADDGDGTVGFIDLADRRPGRRAYYTEGRHVSGFFPEIRASAVVLMDIAPTRKPGCAEHVVSSFDVYVKMRSVFVSAMVKTLLPFIRGLVIRKFTRAFSVAQQVGVLLAKDPEKIKQEMLSFPGLPPEDRAAAEKLLAPLRPEAPSCLSITAARP